MNERMYPLYDKEWLIQKYCVERKSVREIGLLLGCSADPVRLALRRYNIPRRHRPLSEREKEYIDKHKNEYLISYIARRLGELYSEDNGGSRNRLTVKKYIDSS